MPTTRSGVTADHVNEMEVKVFKRGEDRGQMTPSVVTRLPLSSRRNKPIFMSTWRSMPLFTAVGGTSVFIAEMLILIGCLPLRDYVSIGAHCSTSKLEVLMVGTSRVVILQR
uniref:Uncharacterized protein n=1 Tax=Lotharella globosa TaxID=91324 RepID=A0A6V3L8T9_9EUKA